LADAGVVVAAGCAVVACSAAASALLVRVFPALGEEALAEVVIDLVERHRDASLGNSEPLKAKAQRLCFEGDTLSTSGLRKSPRHRNGSSRSWTWTVHNEFLPFRGEAFDPSSSPSRLPAASVETVVA
jgi:hypothetical protein